MDEAEASSDGFSEWVQIQSPTHSNPQDKSLQQQKQQHDLSVFPPIHHEGLTEIVSSAEEEVNSSVSSWSSTAGDKPNSGALKKAAHEIGTILSNGIVKVGARVRYYMDFGCGVWSVGGAVSGVVAAVLISFVYAKFRRWRSRVKEEKKDRLVFLIQEKDQVLP